MDFERSAFRVARILAKQAIFSHGGRVLPDDMQSSDPTESIEERFPDLRYDRVCRTPRSEAYLLSEGESPFGRVDLHFGSSVVNAVLIVERELDEQDLHALVQRIDDDLVWTADEPREDFMVTIYRGSETGVISDRNSDELLDEDDEEDEEEI
ncbi:MAG: hypothetical protein M3069_27435 [Chloroflexota bacterium]|nr:hypothetical protein [Chloroflexota bacterium]